MKIYHLDLKVAMYQEEWLLNLFERLKESGYDGICIEIDNKLIFPSHPCFAAPDALSAAQWHSLILAGKEMGLEIYPLIQTLGHMQHILQPDTYLRSLAESPGNNYLLCPSRAGSIDLVRDLVKDVHTIFGKPGRIHLGGDESRGLGTCPHCAGRNKSELLVNYMKQLHEVATSLDMELELWADMVLAHPETLDHLPTDICFIDWRYRRTALQAPTFSYCYGYPATFTPEGLTADELLAGLPPHLEPLRPYLTDSEGNCNLFAGVRFLQDKGFKAMVASAVRSAGDNYALPRTRISMLNVGATEMAARELGVDHMVTSWAVRLSHPDTTWPALMATTTALDDDTLADVGESIGGLDNQLLADLDIVQEAIDGIDRLSEQEMRYQRPYYGNLMGEIGKIREAADADALYQRVEARLDASRRLIALFEDRYEESDGDAAELEHWLSALLLIELRSQQTLQLLRPSEDVLREVYQLIEVNRRLAAHCADIWRDSLTPESLVQELEIKFYRDIRVLTGVMGN